MSSKVARVPEASERMAAAEILTRGGDERIWLDPNTGRNRYGCGVEPETRGAEFASTTASTISRAALDNVSPYFEALHAHGSSPEAYADAARQVRGELARLCALPPSAADNIILAPSGTDLHLMVADLARGCGADPLAIAMPDPSETGRGVPLAVRCQRFGAEAAHGRGGEIGATLFGAVAGHVKAITLRQPDGRPRPGADVDADFERACLRSLRAGRRVLLILVDVSKTGLIAPSPACAFDLKRRYGERLTVLVDACQFRLSTENLTAYLAADFLVAVTGSKFVAGPAFSGALILPEASASDIKARPLLPALADFSGRQDWPAGFAGRNVLPDLPNFGMLARWRAALFELAAFRSLCPAEITAFLARFAKRIDASLDRIEPLDRVDATPLRRLDDGRWDAIQTIFTFGVADGERSMSASQLQALCERLRQPPAGDDMVVRLGQPVSVGWGQDQPRSALRISASAPVVVEALNAPDGGDAVIDRAVEALEITARVARQPG